jgi:hypothetical protein
MWSSDRLGQHTAYPEQSRIGAVLATFSLVFKTRDSSLVKKVPDGEGVIAPAGAGGEPR